MANNDGLLSIIVLQTQNPEDFDLMKMPLIE